MLKYKSKLLFGFLFGTYHKHFYPLNLMKNYYGEKQAFEYAFLLHYQAWLYIPSFLGLVLGAYQLYRYYLLQDWKAALDTEYNGVFGLLVALWASFFVESWKRKQKYIQHIWNCSDKSFSKVDEREDEFKYYSRYNEITNRIENLGEQASATKTLCKRFASFLILSLVIVAIIVYRTMILQTKGTLDEEGNVVTAPTREEQLWGFGYSLIYSVFIVLVGYLYRIIANSLTEDENYKYQANHDNALISRLFLFNFFNYYVPLFVIAVDQRNKRNYDDIFFLLVSSLGYK